MTEWRELPDNGLYGIAIYTYSTEEQEKLSFLVGESVHILEEEDNWFYGYIISDHDRKGILPRSYINVVDCRIDHDENTSTWTFNIIQPPIVSEVTQVIREWGYLWKKLYITDRGTFDIIKTLIYELINFRSKISSGTLPVDELKQVTKHVAAKIAEGNNILKLDLVVRGANCEIINPDKISTIQLYKYHEAAASLKNEAQSPGSPPSIRSDSFIFLVSVVNFTSKMSEDAELLMFLYDAKEYCAITENYVVRWSKDGLMRDLDQMNNLRVMFTDLSKKDLKENKIYFVCSVVRVGLMEIKEQDHRRSSISTNSKKSNPANGMRRPFGVAAKDVTAYVSGETAIDFDKEISIPFYNCEKDNLEQTLRKIMNKEDMKVDNKNQSLFVKMKLLYGDVKQVKEENPHLILGNVSIARKMGFPEVILPGDVRNDVYLTLMYGEYPKGSKTSDKNVEVTVKVCNKAGDDIPNVKMLPNLIDSHNAHNTQHVISMGGDTDYVNEYRSVIYYHEDKPQWHETIKIKLLIEEFKDSHIKFVFKHRSSSEAKDKYEKPFAIGYINLMETDGTAIRDAKHNVYVYKIDHKKFNLIEGREYLELPPKEDEGCSIKPVPGLTLSSKDSFTVRTKLCSTKLTQNVNLLGLLNWSSHRSDPSLSLNNLMLIDGEDIVKFLQDILDALFNIYQDDTTHDALIYDCLLHVIGIVNDWRYEHFGPVLDLYIRTSFSSTLAHKKLVIVLNQYIQDILNMTTVDYEIKSKMYRSMRSLQRIMRFVSRSRTLYLQVSGDSADERVEFEQDVERLLNGLLDLICEKSEDFIREQGACLKYIPNAITEIMMIFDPAKLSYILCDLFERMPENLLTKQKIMTMNDIVHSDIFRDPNCRQILLPVFTKQINTLFELYEEVELCIKVMGDILNLLFNEGDPSNFNSIQEIIFSSLRTISQSYIKMDKGSAYATNLVAILIDMFRQMQLDHYQSYISRFPTNIDIIDFLMELLMIFKELISHSIFKPDWNEMIMLQNHVILKALRYFKDTIIDYFFKDFEQQIWNNFFQCAIAFMTQKVLQLEAYTCNKRLRIVKRYRDMRREMGFEVRSMWFNLGKYKPKFVPGLVENILEMTLIPENALRQATIPIFFDMMQCEYNSSSIEMESYGDTIRNSYNIKGRFDSFENELISKLDLLVGEDRGDENYKTLFQEIMLKNCKGHKSLQPATRFVNTVANLLERLLQYRNVKDDENREIQMICIVNLLDFYSEIDRKEMYIRYVNKLYDLHFDCENFTEAAYTLDLHCKLLKWSNESLTPLLKTSKFPDAKTHIDLKELLYYRIIDNYDKGQMWECALDKCEELVKLYMHQTFDYEALGRLHMRMADFYNNIMTKDRKGPEYYKIAYYGTTFPKFLQNKVLIYRGKPYEMLADFRMRIMNQFPKAELYSQLTAPSEEIKKSPKQYIQINKVDPIYNTNEKFSGKNVADKILKFYHENHINQFQFSRRFGKPNKMISCTNEFATMWLERYVLTTEHSLPGILMWFSVKESKVFEISPLNNAIETMQNANKDLRTLFLMYQSDQTMSVKSISLKLNGILDPAVMGGIMNYEECFFTDEYAMAHPENEGLIEQLKELIAEQVPLLEACLEVHKQIAEPTLLPLHERMEACFAKMKEDIHSKYGVKTYRDVNLEYTIHLRKTNSKTTDEMRMSETVHATDNVGTRSRVSSLTRAQVASFKNLTSSFNFSNSSPQSSNSKHSSPSTRSLLLSPSRSLSSTPIGGKKNKAQKDKRRSSKIESLSQPPTPSAQWYTCEPESSAMAVRSNGVAVVELREELTAKRPLRSEVEKEKRLSRTSSGHFSRPPSLSLTLRAASSSGNSSNRDSIGTTDSSVSEEDLPPPLPLKTRDADYWNLPPTFICSPPATDVAYSFTSRASKLEFEKPPTPPPKPPKKKPPPIS